MRRRVEPQHLEIAPDRAEDLEEARALLGKRDVQFALHRAQPRQVHVGGVDEVDAVQLEVEKGQGAQARVEELKQAALFAKKIGVTDIATHAGFLPENPTDEKYEGVVSALREICAFYKENGINFLFETGQETPVTVLRTIKKIGLDNVFINFDTANLILYGKGNPVDALRVFGKYVRNTHIKDGVFPEGDGMLLGKETPVGEGLADIPTVLKMLKELGYEGAYTIEREITGEEQKRDIAKTAAFLRAQMEALA